MRTQWTFAIVILICVLSGCSLESVPERGEQCPGINDESEKTLQFIVKPINENGEKCENLQDCKCNDAEQCPEFAENFTLSVCPKDISSCHQTKTGEHYCIVCSQNQVACSGICVDPNSNEYCGAKGECNNDDATSMDYIGKKCGPNYKCVEGVCKEIVECASKIYCDGNCLKINSNDYDHCGAKGECSDDSPSSDNYKGKDCVGVMGNHAVCLDGECICTEGYVNVNGICVDPTDNEYCGAQDGVPGENCGDTAKCVNGVCVCLNEDDVWVKESGKCVDPQSSEHCGATEDSLGENCIENAHCVNRLCVCMDGFALCGEKCIDTRISNFNCGARGTCDDPDETSANYQGKKCDKSAECIEGECVCDDGYIKCGEECINPFLSNTHCGAKGECNSEDPKSDDYQGAVCEEDLKCGDGVCLYQNGCPTNACSLNSCMNTDEQCGMQCMNCNGYGYTEHGFCKLDKGICEITECKKEYHLNADNTDCEKNTVNKCASVTSNVTVDCESIQNVDSVKCNEEGACSIEACMKGFHLNAGKTGCEANSDTECAPVSSNEVKNCKTENNALEGKCLENGKCSIIKCRENYHFNEHKTGCEPNSQVACAPQDSSSTAICANDNIRGNCTREGKCDCTEEGHLLDNGSCEADSNQHCGKHGNECPIDSTCTKGTCYADKCTALTNTLLCAGGESICKKPAKQTYYACVNLTTHHTQCFNTGGTNSSNIDCTKRTDSTGKCIYEPELHTDNGWNCECKDPAKHFQHYHDDVTGWSWLCK